jgi:uncharacterized protein
MPAGVIDCAIEHSWNSSFEVFDHLSSGWHQYMASHVPEAMRLRMIGPDRKKKDGDDAELAHLARAAMEEYGRTELSPISTNLTYHNPMRATVVGSGGTGKSKFESLKSDHLDPVGVERALLCHGASAGALVPTIATTRLTVEVTRAINDWTIDRWLSHDDRLYGSILVPTAVPDLAAAEIRRVAARHDRMVAVLMMANPLGKPFGHPVYHAIYAAAEECGVNVIIRSGGDTMNEAPGYPTAGGNPETFAVYRALAPQAVMTHVASVIAQGVNEWYPSVRFLLLDAGVTWITPYFWRFDIDYKGIPQDVPWLKDKPSAYFREFFKVGTNPFRLGTSPEKFIRYLEVNPDLADMMCYASGYPNADYATWDAVNAALPPEWSERVMRENALEFFGQRTQASKPSQASEALA